MVPNEETLLIHLRQEITRVVLFFDAQVMLFISLIPEISKSGLKEFECA